MAISFSVINRLQGSSMPVVARVIDKLLQFVQMNAPTQNQLEPRRFLELLDYPKYSWLIPTSLLAASASPESWETFTNCFMLEIAWEPTVHTIAPFHCVYLLEFIRQLNDKLSHPQLTSLCDQWQLVLKKIREAGKYKGKTYDEIMQEYERRKEMRKETEESESKAERDSRQATDGAAKEKQRTEANAAKRNEDDSDKLDEIFRNGFWSNFYGRIDGILKELFVGIHQVMKIRAETGPLDLHEQQERFQQVQNLKRMEFEKAQQERMIEQSNKLQQQLLVEKRKIMDEHRIEIEKLKKQQQEDMQDHERKLQERHEAFLAKLKTDAELRDDKKRVDEITREHKQDADWKQFLQIEQKKFLAEKKAILENLQKEAQKEVDKANKCCFSTMPKWAIWISFFGVVVALVALVVSISIGTRTQ